MIRNLPNHGIMLFNKSQFRISDRQVPPEVIPAVSVRVGRKQELFFDDQLADRSACWQLLFVPAHDRFHSEAMLIFEPSFSGRGQKAEARIATGEIIVLADLR